jgi:hypothetical protein
MYDVSKSISETYGPIISINRVEASEISSPFDAFNIALAMRRLWKDAAKIRFFIDGQVLTAKQAENWALYEYKSLPKCSECGKILGGSIYTNNILDGDLYCKQSCADKAYIFQMAKIDSEDEYECDYK